MCNECVYVPLLDFSVSFFMRSLSFLLISQFPSFDITILLAPSPTFYLSFLFVEAKVIQSLIDIIDRM